MHPPSEATGSPDDVAWAAIAGAGITLAVSEDPKAAKDLAGWLQHAVPNLEATKVARVPAEDLIERLEKSPLQTDSTVMLVPDAADGDTAKVEQRWSLWNSARDRMLAALREGSAKRSIVLLATRTRMPEISRAAPDLLAVAQVVTVSDEPFAVSPNEEDLVKSYRLARDELERRYGFSTAEFIDKLRLREAHGVEPDDVNRWQAVAEALRKVDP